MKYRYLGSTGLSVSELCFGAMTFGEKGAFLGAPGRNWSEFGVVPENTAYDLVYKALDAGDTTAKLPNLSCHYQIPNQYRRTAQM